jgi:hypothetical protein
MNIKTLICKIKIYFSKGLISAFIDGALDEAAENRIRDLIAHCPEARLYMKRLLQLDNDLKAIPTIVPSEGIKQRIDNAIIEQGNIAIKDIREKGPLFKKWIYIGLSAFAVMMVATMLVTIKRYNNGTKQTETMFAAIDMYQNMDMYKHMDMIEHLQEIMAINGTSKTTDRVKE